MTDVEAARAVFAAYRAQDRPAAEALYADGFVFTSPQDDHIDRATFFERCFPTADRFVTQTLLAVVPGRPGEVFVLYEYMLADGATYRNTEVLTFRAGRLVETQVFFGGRVVAPR